jgi:beta-mannanase
VLCTQIFQKSFVLLTILAVVGCGGGGGSLPQAGNAASLSDVSIAQSAARPMSAQRVADATPTATPFNPSALPIVADTNPSTAGIFLGDSCGSNAIVPCLDFATTFRHNIAFGTTYATWDERLAKPIGWYQLASWSSQGIIPEITWAPESSTQTITLAGIADGDFDTYITESAQDVAAFGQPIYIRPFHERNGKVYPWSIGKQGDDAQADANFIAAWRRVVNIFRQQGANNAKFVWCYNDTAHPNDQWNQPSSLYPGDSYVDWVAFDGYNRGSATNGKRWYMYQPLFQRAYTEGVDVAPTKPIMISETGSNEYGDDGTMKADWIVNMLQTVAESPNPFPNIRAISWFEANTNGFTYVSNSTMPAYQAFTTSIRGKMANGLPLMRSNGAALWTINKN